MLTRLLRSSASLAVLAAIGSTASAQAPAAAPPPALSDSAIRAIIKERVDSRGSTGIAVGVIGPDGKQRVFTYGSSGTARPIDGNTVFEIGSITKVFTTAILADMVAKGEVSLDDPVAKHLPASARVPSRNGRQITLLDLATQSSGLPRMPSNFTPKDPSNPYADYSAEQALAFLSKYELTRDIGTTYEYSNYGMGLLGIALAHRAGMSYEDLVTRRILQPLGMTDTRIGLTPAMRERLALGHDQAGSVVGNWDITGLAAAGALRSTVNDMLKFLAANMDSTSSPLGRILAATHSRRQFASGALMNVGLGWHVRPKPDGEIVWHNGGTGGYRSFTGFDPGRRTGVVVLTNASTSADDIGFHIVEPRLPLRAPTTPNSGRREITLAPEVLERYVGEYQLAPTFSIVVTREGSSLFGQATNQPRFQLFAEKEDAFFLRVVDARVTFTKDASGAVTGLVLHQNQQDMPGRRIR